MPPWPPGHVGLDPAQDRRITSRRKTDFLIFRENFRFLKSLARSLRRELKCLNRHAPWPSCQMILIRPPAAALKRRDHQRADPASNSPEPDAQGSGTHDNRTHSSSFRQIKKKAVQFKCGRPLANKWHGGSEPIRRRRKVPERIDTQTFNVL